MKVSLKNRILGHRVDPELVDAYRSAIPSDVQLNITQNGDTLLAQVTGLEHKPMPDGVFLVTEARNQAELVDMINDLIFSYKRIPEKYRPFYRQILKPEGTLANYEAMSLVKSS